MARQRPRPLLYQLVRYDLAVNKLSIEDNILPAIQIAGFLNPIDALLDQVPDSLHIFLGHSIDKQAQMLRYHFDSPLLIHNLDCGGGVQQLAII